MNSTELKIQKNFIASLRMPKRKTKKSLVVGIVGIVGSGKSTVANELAKSIGAAVVSADAIRLKLRAKKQNYDSVWDIGKAAALAAMKKGSNVVLDTDMANSEKRTDAIRIIKKSGARFVMVRVAADLDMIIGRILSLPANEFFKGASTDWKGSAQERGVVIKLREMARRIPHHYTWENKEGGRWVPKKFPFPVFTTIDTTDGTKWKSTLKKIAKKI